MAKTTKKRKSKKSRRESSRPRELSRRPETEFKGPNVNKRHRKPDEIYGDTSIPDSARRE